MTNVTTQQIAMFNKFETVGFSSEKRISLLFDNLETTVDVENGDITVSAYVEMQS